MFIIKFSRQTKVQELCNVFVLNKDESIIFENYKTVCFNRFCTRPFKNKDVKYIAGYIFRQASHLGYIQDINPTIYKHIKKLVEPVPLHGKVRLKNGFTFQYENIWDNFNDCRAFLYFLRQTTDVFPLLKNKQIRDYVNTLPRLLLLMGWHNMGKMQDRVVHGPMSMKHCNEMANILTGKFSYHHHDHRPIHLTLVPQEFPEIHSVKSMFNIHPYELAPTQIIDKLKAIEEDTDQKLLDKPNTPVWRDW